MSVKTTKDVIRNFISNADPSVLAIKGGWGSGKTYIWNTIIDESWDAIALEKYSYVSLFGVTSIADVKTAIYMNGMPIRDEIDDKREFKEAVTEIANKVSIKITGRKIPSVSDLRQKYKSAIDSSPFGKAVNTSFDLYAQSETEKILVCLDDMERLAESITAEQLLGMISQLKTEKNCKVVIIFNDKKVPARIEKIYEEFKEKVVDLEVRFEPTAREACDIAFKELQCYPELATECAIKLDINNIRVLGKIHRNINLITPVLVGLHKEVTKNAIMSIVMLACVHYQAGKKVPSLKFIREWNRFSWNANRALRGEKQDEIPEEKEWAQLLTDYSYSITDELDEAIIKIIEFGYIEGSGLLEAAEKSNKDVETADLRRGFEGAWDVFHESFEVNDEFFVKNLIGATQKAIGVINAMELDATTSMLRKLGCENEANELLDLFVEKRSGQPGIFNLKDHPFKEDVRDDRLKERFAAEFEKHKPVITLREAALIIAGNEGYTRDHATVILNAPAEEFYWLLKSDLGRKLSTVISSCVRLHESHVDGENIVFPKVMKALERIGKESRLNGLRAVRFGLSEERLAAQANQIETPPQAD